MKKGQELQGSKRMDEDIRLITSQMLSSLTIFWTAGARENIKNRIGFIVAGSASSGKSVFYKLIAKTFGVVDVQKTQGSKVYVCYFRDDLRRLFKTYFLQWLPWILTLLSIAFGGYFFYKLPSNKFYYPVALLLFGLSLALLVSKFGKLANEKFLIMLYDRKGEIATTQGLDGTCGEDESKNGAGYAGGPKRFIAGPLSWEPQGYRDPSIEFEDYNILWAIVTMVAPFDIKDEHFRNVLKRFDWNAFSGYPILKNFIVVKNYSKLAKQLEKDFQPKTANEKRLLVVIALTRYGSSYSVSLIEGLVSNESLKFYNTDCNTLKGQNRVILGWDYDYVNESEGYVGLQIANENDSGYESGWRTIMSKMHNKTYENNKSSYENIYEVVNALDELIKKEKDNGRNYPLVYFCSNDGAFAGEKEGQTYEVLNTMIMEMLKKRSFKGDYPYPEYKDAILDLLKKEATKKSSESVKEADKTLTASDTQERNIAD